MNSLLHKFKLAQLSKQRNVQWR